HDLAAAGAGEAAQLALQVAARRAEIEVPPAPPRAPIVGRPAQTAAARADQPAAAPAQADDHSRSLEANACDARPRDREQAVECGGDAHDRPPSGASVCHGQPEPRAAARHLASHSPAALPPAWLTLSAAGRGRNTQGGRQAERAALDGRDRPRYPRNSRRSLARSRNSSYSGIQPDAT